MPQSISFYRDQSGMGCVFSTLAVWVCLLGPAEQVRCIAEVMMGTLKGAKRYFIYSHYSIIIAIQCPTERFMII